MGDSFREDITIGGSVLQQEDWDFLLRVGIRALFRIKEAGGEGGEQK